MKAAEVPRPSEDRRWKIIDGRMRKLGYAGHGLIEVLHAVQESFGYLDKRALLWVARSLGLPPSKVYGVATFYNLFTLEPQGAHLCVVCLGTACYVKGAPGILAAVERSTGTHAGATTPDGRLSLLTARCMGSCGIAPVMVCDGTMIGRLTPKLAAEKMEEVAGHAARGT